MRLGARAIVVTFALALGACSGTLGSGGGLSIPQTPQNAVPPGPNGASAGAGTSPTSAVREKVRSASIVVEQGARGFALPALDGFSIAVDLGPAPAPATPAAATASAAVSVAPSPSSSAGASAAPNGGASAAPNGGPSAAPNGGPSAAPETMPAKTTIYPRGAPAAPTAQPSADASPEAAVNRVALVRGYIVPARDLTLYGLGAFRFSLPKAELTDRRGYTVAAYEAGKKGHDKLLQFDAAATLREDAVGSASAPVPLPLKKGVGYVVLLYADEVPATPPPVEAGYPSPGNNPFVTPAPQASGSAAGVPAGAPPTP